MGDQTQLSRESFGVNVSNLLFANKLVGCSPIPVDVSIMRWFNLASPVVERRYVFTRFKAETDRSHEAFVAGITNNNFTITAEIHARSLVKFYCQYADRHKNLKFMRRVSKRERAIRQFVIVKTN